MPIKLTAESFLAGVRQSGLIDEKRLDEVLGQLKSSGVDMGDSESLAKALVDRSVISNWQSDKLLQGKHKGFILGRYRLIDLLGRGEMSSVYLAEHVMMKRRCAVKVLPAHRVKDTSYLGRFHREAEAVASLDHANIVRAYDVGQENEAGAEIHFLVMEYVEGRSLDRRLEERGEFKLVEAAEYIRQAAEGLAHAHENGLVHRDIKPGNLLIDGKETVKLLDLGLARFFKSTDEESLTIKHDEKVLGTADYLAPEQAVDSHAVDERADIYSLGCTFYFALTGQPPFTDGTLVQRLLAHQTKAPQPIQRLRADVPTSLADIIDRMMRKAPEDRYQTAADVAQALGLWLIENADDEWKQRHPEIVARLSGIDALLPKAETLEQSPEPVAVEDESSIHEQAIQLDQDVARQKPQRPKQRKKRRKKPTPAGHSVPSSAARTPRKRKPATSHSTAQQSSAVDEEVVAALHRPAIGELPSWRFIGIPINAQTGSIAALILLAALIAGGWGLNLMAETEPQPIEPAIPGNSEFNEPGPGERIGPFNWTGD